MAHQALSGVPVVLKASADLTGRRVDATWDFGDGSAPQRFTPASSHDLAVRHTYTGPAGSAFKATLTLVDAQTGESSLASYPVILRSRSLETDANLAIQEGLWHLHQTQDRASGGWRGDCAACDPAGTSTASNVLAFEIAGYLRGDEAAFGSTVGLGLDFLLTNAGQKAIRTADWARALEAANDPERLKARAPEAADADSGLKALRASAASLSDEAARELLARQLPGGYWSSPDGTSGSLETARALIALGVRFLAGSAITNVTSQVSISSTAIAFNRFTRVYSSILTITNITASAIAGPLSVQLRNLTGGVTLSNADGSFGGFPYRVFAGVVSLAPGASASVSLQFGNPAAGPINYTPIVYSGTLPPNPLTVACPVNSGQTGTAYNSALVGDGGVLPYTYSIGPGALPDGLTLNPATGVIDGIPTVANTFNFTANLNDGTGLPSGIATASCTITIALGTISVTVQTVPAGRSIVVDGTTLTAPQTFTWQSGSNHIIATTTPQGSGGTRYVFNNWSDGGAISHQVSPTSAITYTATFDTEYQLTTAAAPANGGTVTPASGSFFPAGSVQNVSATANSGFAFANWTGPVADANAAATTVTMTGPVSITANFGATVPVTVQTSPAGLSIIVDGTTLTAPQSFNWVSGSNHTIATTSPQGSGGTRQLFNSWSDGGAISHSVSPNAAITYTATFDTQYQLTTAAAPSNGGTVTPASGSFFAANSVQNVSAAANSGFAFNNWTGPVANANAAATTVTMTGPISVTANFNTTNQTPTATGQATSTNEDTQKVITLAGSDPDGNPLTFILVSAPAHGNVVNFGAGTCVGTPSNCTRNVTYTPAANYNGTDSFTFKVNDGTVDSAAATVTITVNAVNDPPVLTAKAFSVHTNMRLAGGIGTMLAGASDANDPENASPAFTLTAMTVSSGAVTFAGDGSFTYDPPVGFAGLVTINYTVCDNGTPGFACTSTTGSFNISGPVIWFVNPALGSNGNGTLNNPFNVLSSATTVAGSNSGHRIFVFNGTTASGTGVTLVGDQWLVGQGVTGASFDAVMGITVPAGTIARPSINGTHPIIQGTVNLNGNNTHVQGLRIQPPAGSKGLVASLAGPFTGLVVGDILNITTSGAAGTAVDLANVSGTISITAVNTSTTAIGINLSNLNPSTGSFTIAGNGGTCTAATPTCTGGTIASPTDTGIKLNNVRGVTFTRMQLNGSGNFGLNGTTVSNMTIDTSVFSGTHGNLIDEGALYVTNWTGTGAITNSDISGGANDTVRVTNTTGSLNRLTISGTTIHDHPALATANHGLRFAQGCTVTPAGCSGAVMNLTIQNSTFRDNASNHIDVGANGLGSMDIVLTSNTLATPNTANGGAVNITADHSADLTFDVNGNLSTGSRLGAFNFFTSNQTTNSASMIGKFRNNVIGTTGVALSGSRQGNGVDFNQTGLATMTVNVTGNQIRRFLSQGINLSSGDSGNIFNATVTGNLVQEGDATFALNAIAANMGTTAAGAVTACIDIGGAGALGNTVQGAVPTGTELRARQRNASTVRLPGYAGGALDTAAVSAYLLGRNTATGGSASATVNVNGFTGGGACTQAP